MHTHRPLGILMNDAYVRVDRNGTAECLPPDAAPADAVRMALAFTRATPQAFLCALDALWSPFDINVRASLTNAVCEWAGVALAGGAGLLGKGLLLTAEPGGSPSWLQKLLVALFPAECVSHEHLGFLATSNGAAGLEGKRLCLAGKLRDDLRHQELEQIKRILAGDPVAARRIYGNPFVMTPACGLIATLDEPGRIADLLGNEQRRWIIVPLGARIEHPLAAVDAIEQIVAAEHAAIISTLLQYAANALRRGYYLPLQVPTP